MSSPRPKLIVVESERDQVSHSSHDAAAASALMGRIATTLGIPQDAFHRASLSAAERSERLDESAEALRLFDQIIDRRTRQRCLAVLRDAVGQSA